MTYTRYNAGKSNEFFEVNLSQEAGKQGSIYTFDTKKEVEAFFSGFQLARSAANALIQLEMPMSISELKLKKEG